MHLWIKDVITWQDLWEHFAARYDKQLARVGSDVLREQNFTRFAQVEAVNGYLIDQTFIARLAKITPEQVDAVLDPIIKVATADNVELKKIFAQDSGVATGIAKG
ncbi:MAG: hypothetical protein OYH77_04760 [Pseudomonadota bacterium]|nr:hypothetical protein [Pseudomonadota bacterium]